MRIKGQLSPAQGRALLAQAEAKENLRGNKFNAQRTTTEHGVFDSKHEANWAARLNWAQREGYIEGLVTEKRGLLFALDVNGYRICQYEADAKFVCLKSFELPTFQGIKVLEAGKSYVLDAKSPPTRKKSAYIYKHNLMYAIYGIEVLEV